MIEVSDLTVVAGAFRRSGLNLSVPTGAYGVLMGRTGCGKSTLLETVCGLKPSQGGTVRLGGIDVTDWTAAARGIGYVPQDGALFSRLTVREHLAFALRVRGRPNTEIDARVHELSKLLGLEPLLDRLPANLSGGEAQRTALGRALSFRPRYLCLDEPLSALDEDTRTEMCLLLRRIPAQTGVTALHVTHSRREAEMLADALFEFRDGRIERVGGKPSRE